MKEEILVSVAVCTYNGGAYIKEQLDSILNQTYSNLEILICDDKSQDNTLSIVRSYADPRIRILESEENVGLESNFFKAIEACNGDYIALSDQDDIWLPNKVQTLVEHIGGHMLVYADSEFVDETGKSLNKRLSSLRKMYEGSDARAFSLYYLTSIFGHALMFSKLLKPALKKHPEICHDGWIGFIAATQGSIAYVDKVLVRYRQHNQSVTRQTTQGDKARFERFLQIWFHYLEESSNNTDKPFFSKLNNLYRKRKGFGMLEFLGFLHRHRSAVFCTKTSFFSRLNLLRKIYQKTRGGSAKHRKRRRFLQSF